MAAWLALATAMLAGALAGRAVAPGLLDWQPGAVADQPWRAWTAALVHWSDRHLAVNLAGALAVAAFGVAAQLPPAACAAWLAAWPLGHVALLAQPQLQHYAGLSGVLHAGVAVAAVFLTAAGPRRATGAVVLGGLLLQIALEAPWGPLLRDDALTGVAVAPIAHATGTIAGVAAAVVACLLGYHRRTP